MPELRHRKRKVRHSSSIIARNSSMITTRIDDLEASLDRIRSARSGLYSRKPTRSRGIAGSIGSLKSLTAGDTNIHGIVEKAADLTSRWQKTASMAGLVGNNIKSIAGPLLGRLNPLSGLLKGVGGSGSNLAQTLANATTRSAKPGGGSGMDLGNLVQAAQSVLGQMSRSGAGPTTTED